MGGSDGDTADAKGSPAGVHLGSGSPAAARAGAAAGEQIRRFRGREIDTAGDGFLIAFDGAARAVQCAMAVRERVRRIGLDVRSGVHRGRMAPLRGPDGLTGLNPVTFFRRGESSR